MTKKLCLIIILVGGFEWTYAQTLSASPYSAYGIGIINGKSSALNRSMAGTGIGLRDPNNLNNLNPASYTGVKSGNQIFEIGLYTESDYNQTTEQSDKFSTGGLTGINGWFRFSQKWASVVGLSPFSRVEYNIASDGSTGNNGSSTMNFSGHGGLAQFYFGNSFQITKHLSIGLDASYVFGSIEKKESIVSGLGAGTVLQSKVTANKLKTDFGLQYSLDLSKARSLTLGVVYGPSVKLNTQASMILYQETYADTTFSATVDVDDYVLPRYMGAGLSFQTKRSTIAMDFKFTKWSEAKLEDNVSLRNTARFSLAYAYQRNRNGESYFDFVQLRTGFYFQNNYLMIDNTPFNEWGISASVGLPVAGNRGTINFTYNLNKSGTLDNGMIKQRGNIISVDLIFRDVWGIRSKFD